MSDAQLDQIQQDIAWIKAKLADIENVAEDVTPTPDTTAMGIPFDLAGMATAFMTKYRGPDFQGEKTRAFINALPTRVLFDNGNLDPYEKKLLDFNKNLAETRPNAFALVVLPGGHRGILQCIGYDGRAIPGLGCSPTVFQASDTTVEELLRSAKRWVDRETFLRMQQDEDDANHGRSPSF